MCRRTLCGHSAVPAAYQVLRDNVLVMIAVLCPESCNLRIAYDSIGTTFPTSLTPAITHAQKASFQGYFAAFPCITRSTPEGELSRVRATQRAI